MKIRRRILHTFREEEPKGKKIVHDDDDAVVAPQISFRNFDHSREGDTGVSGDRVIKKCFREALCVWAQ
jgi:hypothetical protein